MSRLSQYIAYLNAEKTPTGDELKFYYTDITITEEMKRERFLYRLSLNKKKKIKTS